MAACEDGETADQVVQTLPGRQPSYIEEDRLVRRQAQRPPRKRLGDRPELATIEAARDDRDARIIRPVEHREVGAVLRTLGDDAVGALDQRPSIDKRSSGNWSASRWCSRRTRPSAWKVTTNGVPSCSFSLSDARPDMKKFACDST